MLRISLLIILVCCVFFSSSAQENTTFILVRHAEKLSDGTSDPDLSEEGIQRSQRIQQLISKMNLDGIYSTPYKRTQQTVSSIASHRNLPVSNYDPRDADFITQLLSEKKGGTVLICGHSNTIPSMINQLTQTNYPNFKEDEYDNLFIVVIHSDGESTVICLSTD